MKKQFTIRVLMLVIIITAAVFVVAAVRANRLAGTEECAQNKDCSEKGMHSEFLLESLIRNVLVR